MGASPMPMPTEAYALCPMPYALCPQEHLMLLRKAIGLLGNYINMILRILVIFEMAAGAMMLNQNLQESLHPKCSNQSLDLEMLPKPRCLYVRRHK